jgi:uncharacterized protein (TIGR03435 family)
MEKWMLWIAASAILSTNTLRAQAPPAQSPSVPDWQTAAGTRMEFDVASVKESKTDQSPSTRPYSNFPMGPGDMYSPNGGHLVAKNWPFVFYLQFAYKMTGGQLQAVAKQMPDWTKTDRFDIEAKVEGDPTKDQMRLMMQSLLAERFKLAIHHETQQLPVFALVLAKPGKTGPKLLPHQPGDTSCSNVPPAPPAPGSAPQPRTIAGGFPVTCGGLAGLPPSARGRVALGYRNVAMGLIANQMTGFGNLDRPVIDQTGLTGNFDFLIEFTPEPPLGATPPPDFDTSGPTFLEALTEQDGLKLIPRKFPVDVIVVDHVEHPSEN